MRGLPLVSLTVESAVITADMAGGVELFTEVAPRLSVEVIGTVHNDLPISVCPTLHPLMTFCWQLPSYGQTECDSMAHVPFLQRVGVGPQNAFRDG